MRRDTREWTVPEPLRALFWWPAAAFVLAIVAPETITWSIVCAGLALMLLGCLALAAKRIRFPAPSATMAGTVTTIDDIPTSEIQRVDAVA